MGLLNILDEYPGKNKGRSSLEVIALLAEKGKVSVQMRRASKRPPCTQTHIRYIKFWPNPKYIEYFRQFDKKKLVD